MPRGRPPLPPDQRRPRRSGPSGGHRIPDPVAAASQRLRMARLAEDLGAERQHRRLAGPGPASWVTLAEVLGLGASRVSQVARGAVVIEEETLARWEREVYSWIEGEARPDPEE